MSAQYRTALYLYEVSEKYKVFSQYFWIYTAALHIMYVFNVGEKFSRCNVMSVGSITCSWTNNYD